MNHFLSLDWGTSRFRLRLVETETLKVLANSESEEGILAIHARWLQEELPEEERLAFYLAFILSHIRKIQKEVVDTIDHLPLLISGMPSSTMGMIELPYKEIPFAQDGSDLFVKGLKGSPDFTHPVWIISGVRTTIDVIRGEETILAGAPLPEWEEQIVVMPGTHSKHMLIRNGRCTDFATYMTGEFFNLLWQKSSLANTIEHNEHLATANDFFKKGLSESVDTTNLRSSFRTRAQTLLKKQSPEENYYYLGGLLIGEECRQLIPATIPINLIAGKVLKPLYEMALRFFEIGTGLEIMDADECFVRGQWNIYRNLM